VRVEPPLPDKRAREGVAAVLPGRGVVQRGVLYAFGQRDNRDKTPPTASYLQGCLWPLYFGHVTVELVQDLQHQALGGWTGVMKDQMFKLMNLHVSHTLGCEGDWNT
jgi:hypothetical protein